MVRVYKIISFSVVILLIAVLFAGAVTVPAAAQTDTMQFRYNAQHTGDYSPVAGSNVSNGKLTWSYTTGDYVVSSPAVANGVVYVGSDDGNVYALNATTGAKLWNYTTGGYVWSPPPPSPTASSTWGAMTTTSTPSTPPPGPSSGTTRPEARLYSSPAVANGVVYVGSIDDNIYALNATTGAKLWNYTTRDYGVLLPRRRQRRRLRGER